MFTVYALYNQDSDKIYIGQTKDIIKRVKEHNSSRNTHYTGKIKGEWQLVYEERAATRSEAISREKQLKSYRGREFIKTQIPH